MKRKLCILCCIAIIISMVGCTSEKKETNEERSDTKKETNEERSDTKIETNEENEESKDDVIFDHEMKENIGEGIFEFVPE